MSASKRRKFLVITVFLMVLVITISLFVYLDSQKPYTGKVESITVGTIPNEAYFANFNSKRPTIL